MATSTSDAPPSVGAVAVEFEGDLLTFVLDDARRITVDLTRVPWLNWLLEATPEAREKYQIEQPAGFAVYWPDLDDGVEMAHLLVPTPVG